MGGMGGQSKAAEELFQSIAIFFVRRTHDGIRVAPPAAPVGIITLVSISVIQI
ncbi:MAG: hypothetical protein ACREFN_05725 [Acetobacteraceae bacterium]